MHAVFALTQLVPNGTSGESAAMGFLIYDLPLHALVNSFDWAAPFRFASGRHYVLFFSTVGTLMHAGIGWCVGALVSAVAKLMRPPSN